MAVGRHAFVFAGCRFDPLYRALSRREPSGAWSPVAVGARALGILALLLEQRGAPVSKDRIMEAVWPSTVVGPNNLAVQIAALRRVLDGGLQGESLIETVPGQGYRLTSSVAAESGRGAELDEDAPDEDGPLDGAAKPLRGLSARSLFGRHMRAAIVGMAMLAIIGIAVAWNLASGQIGAAATAPRVSVVVVPFEDLSAETETGPLARALTADVAADLARWQTRFGVPRSVATASGREKDAGSLLREFGARYALQGRMRRLGGALRVNLQLVDTASGIPLWSKPVDVELPDPAAAEAEAVRRIVETAGEVILTVEIDLRQRLRPDHPHATDLMLLARRLELLPPSPQRLAEARALFERVLQLGCCISAATRRRSSGISGVWLTTLTR